MFRIHVDGPPSSGKTALAELLLSSLGRDVLYIRYRHKRGLKCGEFDWSGSDPERRRCLAAGASGAVRYCYSRIDTEEFLVGCLRRDSPRVLLVEGDLPFVTADLRVLVTRLPRGGRFLRKGAKPQPWMFLAPGQMPRELAMCAEQPSRDLRAAPFWRIPRGLESALTAQVVLLNLSGGECPTQIERFVREVHRMRADPAVFESLGGGWTMDAYRQRISVVSADLGTREGAGCRAVVRKVAERVSGWVALSGQ